MGDRSRWPGWISPAWKKVLRARRRHRRRRMVVAATDGRLQVELLADTTSGREHGRAGTHIGGDRADQRQVCSQEGCDRVRRGQCGARRHLGVHRSRTSGPAGSSAAGASCSASTGGRSITSTSRSPKRRSGGRWTRTTDGPASLSSCPESVTDGCDDAPVVTVRPGERTTWSRRDAP